MWGKELLLLVGWLCAAAGVHSARLVGQEVGVRAWAWSGRRGASIHAYTYPRSGEEQLSGESVTSEAAEGAVGPGHDNELKMLVLNQRTGRVMMRRGLATGEAYTWWAELVWWLGRVAPGRLVVLSASGLSTRGLRHARILFTHFGAQFALFLSHATQWSWAFIKGGRTLYETVVRGEPLPQAYGLEYCSSDVWAEGLVPLSTLPSPVPSSDLDRHRWQYCAAHGAMGGFCDEESPDPLPPPPVGPVAHQQALDHVPVVVTAGHRHQYLYHSLTRLLAAPGARRDQVLVVVGGAPPATTDLLQLLGLNYTTVHVQGVDNHKLFRYYRQVFRLAAQTFPDAPAVILLDEDVQVSPDFFSFFSQTLPLLYQDNTLYCITAYSPLPKMSSGRGAQYVRRGALQPYWGYALSMDFVREALRSWPATTHGLDIHTYDYWLYDELRGERECVYPEVSRSRHYGVGTNTQPYMHEYEAWRRPLLHQPHVALRNVYFMLRHNYEAAIQQQLRRARLVTHKEVCGANFSQVAALSSRPLVLYYAQEYNEDISSWFELGQCVGLHFMSDQEHHGGVHLAFYPRRTAAVSVPHPLNKYGLNLHLPTSLPHRRRPDFTPVYFVGVPFSNYSYLRPQYVPVYNVSHQSEEERLAQRARLADKSTMLLINDTLDGRALAASLFTSS